MKTEKPAPPSDPRPGSSLAAGRLRHLLPHCRRHVWGFVWGFLLLAATSLSAAVIPYTMKLATESLEDGAGGMAMGRFALLLILLALVNGLFRIWGRVHIFAIGRQVEYDLRAQYHASLLRLDTAFFGRERTGDLVSRGTTDITALRMFIGPGFLQVCNTLMVYATVVPVMAGLDAHLTLLALAPFPVALLTARLMTRRLYRLSRAVADRFGRLSGFVQEAVTGMAVIRGHAQEDNWRRRFDAEADLLYADHLRHTRLQGTFAPLMMFSGGLGGWIILAVGGPEVAAGRLTVGDFVAFSGYLALLVWPTVGLGWILTVMQRGWAAMERIGMVLDAQPATPVLADPGLAESAPPGHWRGEIQVAGLEFAFPVPVEPAAAPSRPILKSIHMTLPPGSFVGLAGRVGSGKSTLLNCLARLWPAPPGTVLLDGRPLESIPEDELRRNLLLVPQESILFSASMAENLLFGRPGGSEALAWQVAHQVALDQEIRTFPDGMATLVGERGITLSGGQRQRAALARALALDPPVLLLDDVFSSVDARTEETILDQVRTFSRGRTTLMVCHRVAALHAADSIYLLDEGRIVGHGPHHQLIEHSALYRDLHNRMARAEALEALG
ncbi:MAG: ABC transporter ATP-binding protein [Magnetococcales bacterium]|nr:ABC transporter ATP-binding protein [Magnetococcales bacterium]